MLKIYVTPRPPTYSAPTYKSTGGFIPLAARVRLHCLHEY